MAHFGEALNREGCVIFCASKLLDFRESLWQDGRFLSSSHFVHLSPRVNMRAKFSTLPPLLLIFCPLISCLIPLLGCGGKVEEAMNQIGKKTSEAVDKASKAVSKGAKKISNKAMEVTKKVSDKVGKAVKEATSKTVESVKQGLGAAGSFEVQLDKTLKISRCEAELAQLQDRGKAILKIRTYSRLSDDGPTAFLQLPVSVKSVKEITNLTAAGQMIVQVNSTQVWSSGDDIQVTLNFEQGNVNGTFSEVMLEKSSTGKSQAVSGQFSAKVR